MNIIATMKIIIPIIKPIIAVCPNLLIAILLFYLPFLFFLPLGFLLLPFLLITYKVLSVSKYLLKELFSPL
ncbi:MAG: hypothetical protein CMF72_25580 [Mameliella sp.]|nr:hypothetical protein [Mameliella sp.]